MSVGTDLSRQSNDLSAEVLEAVVVGGDLTRLNAQQRLAWYRARCDAAGLDPRTQPFVYLSLSGKLTLYATKAATDSLIGKHQLTVAIVSKEYDAELGIFQVLCRVTTPDGRTVEDVGATNVAGLKGEAMCNAVMKAVTKAKRRTVLSACGLGMPDESEAEYDATIQPMAPQLSHSSSARESSAIETPLPGQVNPGSADSRGYAVVVSDATDITNAAIEDICKAAGIEPYKIPKPSPHRHLFNHAVQLGHHSGTMPSSLGEAVKELSKLYKAQRDFCRVTLADFYQAQVDEAHSLVEPKKPEKNAKAAPAVEEATEEPKPAASDEQKPNESQAFVLGSDVYGEGPD